jgi:phospholipase/lecithinase/hemolysin
VLQEQSTLPIKNASRMAENVRLFDEVIKRAGSKTVLYMTWARKNEPAAQRAIADAYTTIGKELGAIVVPVGLAWERFLAQHDKPVLHDRDQSHPTPAGSYLAACVFLAVLLNCNPLLLQRECKGLHEAEAQTLRAATAAQFRKRR